MPGKSRHKKKQHLPQSKKRKSGQHFATTVAQQQTVTQTREPAPHAGVSAPLASVPTPAAKVAAVQYPHMVAELRMIGILAGIILVILVVLALVLP